jgi:hypothetical protein
MTTILPQEESIDRETRPSPKVAERIFDPNHSDNSWAGAVVTVLPALPFMAAAFTLLVYIWCYTGYSSQDETMPPRVARDAIAWGLGLSIVQWLILLAALYRSGLTTSAGAHSSSWNTLRYRIAEYSHRMSSGPRGGASSVPFICDPVKAFLEKATQALGETGPQWIQGYGYLVVWSFLHNADSALICIEGQARALEIGIQDEQRLGASNIPDAALLQARLRKALTILAPAGSALFDGPAIAEKNTADTDNNKMQASALQAALATIRVIHVTINTFRVSREYTLALIRNRIMATLLCANILTYLALAVAILCYYPPPSIQSMDQNPIIVAAALYIVGAITGLFNRLYIETGSIVASDDFGLSHARLALTPVLSGLAAIIGAVAVPYVGPMLNLPSQLTTAMDSSAAPMLANVLNLQHYPVALALAVLFGLTPGVLIQRLKTITDTYKNELKATD